ncbi:MAG: hypothetical protein WCJ51_02150 [Candidatus Moraniibacteriota bacterium]
MAFNEKKAQEKLILFPKPLQILRQFQDPLGLLGIKQKVLHILDGQGEIAKERYCKENCSMI